MSVDMQALYEHVGEVQQPVTASVMSNFRTLLLACLIWLCHRTYLPRLTG